MPGSHVLRRLRPVSLRARATVMAGTVAALLSITGAAVAAAGLRYQLTRQADATAGATADQLVRSSARPPLTGARGYLRVPDDEQLMIGDRVVGVTGAMRTDQPTLSLWPFTDPTYRVRIHHATLPTGEDLTVIISVRSEQVLVNRVVSSLAVGVAALIAVVMGTTWLVAARVLRPVDAITREVAGLGATDLARRVPVPASRDEIARLAETMNTMLDRLEIAADRQRRFVADASHELRSPLAALQAELEIALSHPKDTPWPEVVRAALGDARRIEHLTADLLLLARLEHDRLDPATMTPVDLAAAATTQVAARDDSRPHWTVETTGPALVAGRPELLARLIGNLLDNAERYADSHITVRVHGDPAAVVLEVLDDGPGIPPADRERIFDRFTRLDEARDRDHGGAGIGLAIARTIATAHGGSLRAGDSSRGAHFLARLPRLTRPPGPAAGSGAAAARRSPITVEEWPGRTAI